jgi:hypothetical protein
MKPEIVMRSRLEELKFALKNPAIQHGHEYLFIKGKIAMLEWVLE